MEDQAPPGHLASPWTSLGSSYISVAGLRLLARNFLRQAVAKVSMVLTSVDHLPFSP